MPATSRNNYNDLIVDLQRKFGDEHKCELYHMEVRWRSQKANESLQALIHVQDNSLILMGH